MKMFPREADAKMKEVEVGGEGSPVGCGLGLHPRGCWRVNNSSVVPTGAKELGLWMPPPGRHCRRTAPRGRTLPGSLGTQRLFEESQMQAVKKAVHGSQVWAQETRKRDPRACRLISSSVHYIPRGVAMRTK